MVGAVTVVDFLVAGRCPGCGRTSSVLCMGCRQRFAPPPAVSPGEGLVDVVAAFAHDGAARDAVAAIKYQGDRRWIELLGRDVATAICARTWERHIDVVCGVPASRSRRQRNGFDHGELLASIVATHLDLPMRRVLVRRAGPAQTGRTARDRRSSPPAIVPRAGAGRSITDRRVLVVDDVVTTGATLRRAAQSCLAAGARSVYAATITARA